MFTFNNNFNKPSHPPNKLLKATRPVSTAPAMALIAGVPGVPGVLRPPVAVGPLLDDEPELLGPRIYIYIYIHIYIYIYMYV